jgi:hypothetical protein
MRIYLIWDFVKADKAAANGRCSVLWDRRSHYVACPDGEAVERTLASVLAASKSCEANLILAPGF